MSGLRPPGLGPIVGHTTDRSCRLWIRAGDPEDEGAELDSERRTVGVLTVTHEAGKPVPKQGQRAFYFRLHREFDRTGTFQLGKDKSFDAPDGSGKATPLKADTEYRVRIGTLTLDDPYRNDKNIDAGTLAQRLPPAESWIPDLHALSHKKSEAVFRTFPKGDASSIDRLSFIMGSCRYPGLLWKIKQADVIFGPLWEEAQKATNGSEAHFVLMVGDQIYADMFNRLVPVGLADTFEEFQERYLTAFGSRNMRTLLRSIPTYMILDDHEIEDNWTQDRFYDGSKRFLFNVAINAYMSYQWSHGARSFGNRLHYKFDCGGYPFFVIDTRTQRFMDDVRDDLADNHLLGRPALDPNEPNQIDRLLNWLAAQQRDHGNAPKFIVSSSVFAPNPMKAREGMNLDKDDQANLAKKTERLEQSDSWPAFPNTRRAVLKCIIDNEIQNVVFLSGDIHCANVAEIYLTGSGKAENLKVFSVTSSALYWPFPFADGEPSDYVHDSRKSGQEDTFDIGDGHEMNYRAWNFTQEDNFCRVDVNKSKAEITVRTFDSSGKVIEKESSSGKKKKLVTRFKLAPW